MFTRFRRPFVTNGHIDGAIEDARVEITSAIDKHGQGAFISAHEVSGVLDEEVSEFKDALHDNDLVQIYKELAQIAQVAIFGMASIRQAVQLSMENEGINGGAFFEEKLNQKSISYPHNGATSPNKGNLK